VEEVVETEWDWTDASDAGDDDEWGWEAGSDVESSALEDFVPVPHLDSFSELL